MNLTFKPRVVKIWPLCPLWGSRYARIPPCILTLFETPQFGMKNVKHEVRFMMNDDKETPTALVGSTLNPKSRKFLNPQKTTTKRFPGPSSVPTPNPKSRKPSVSLRIPNPDPHHPRRSQPRTPNPEKRQPEILKTETINPGPEILVGPNPESRIPEILNPKFRNRKPATQVPKPDTRKPPPSSLQGYLAHKKPPPRLGSP